MSTMLSQICKKYAADNTKRLSLYNAQMKIDDNSVALVGFLMIMGTLSKA